MNLTEFLSFIYTYTPAQNNWQNFLLFSNLFFRTSTINSGYVPSFALFPKWTSVRPDQTFGIYIISSHKVSVQQKNWKKRTQIFGTCEDMWSSAAISSECVGQRHFPPVTPNSPIWTSNQTFHFHCRGSEVQLFVWVGCDSDACLMSTFLLDIAPVSIGCHAKHFPASVVFLEQEPLWKKKDVD